MPVMRYLSGTVPESVGVLFFLDGMAGAKPAGSGWSWKFDRPPPYLVVSGGRARYVETSTTPVEGPAVFIGLRKGHKILPGPHGTLTVECRGTFPYALFPEHGVLVRRVARRVLDDEEKTEIAHLDPGYGVIPENGEEVDVYLGESAARLYDEMREW